ncbi:methylated-DNA--[protein]-cysteine S-methyltransferase [Jeotgalibacillus sp. R-1-5s-1]|uniref:methylated-DNA--[protein]-cysteine S-methyltransferase n=1 Tax=Jeotgalibacillus sp. R-1-5s-1 TaxID=2555897 RepID=UPI00106AC0A3|nr:methylated-DNA--[protein]-cysteine S-methyltransferase [Jeotgalibacillus sp. R-1-5s-1]TFE00790.1 methylated-DNA--[protein]-cysteine S-methyltransferase [Jeotgalibacillus sp. R-1-5s-1]
MTIYWNQFDIKDRSYYIAVSSKGVCYFGTQSEGFEGLEAWVMKTYKEAHLEHNSVKTGPYIEELTDYFDGVKQTFNMKVDVKGTPFQEEVWQALRDIPFGETRSYADIAEVIGRPKAVRAVGGAVGANPVLITIPCHRVIAKDGSIGGFSSGLDLKRVLMRIEGIQLVKNA